MIKGITKGGFRYEVNENIGDDYELLKLLRKMEDNGLLIFDMVEKILGQKQAENLEKFLLKRDGYVSTEKISKEVMEIFTGNPLLKKLLTLAGMMNFDEEALLCDLAETYHIYDFEQLSPQKIAVFFYWFA